MDQTHLRQTLAPIGIRDLRYFDSIGSTNDEALAWAAQGALDLSLVAANEQTAGRGRAQRKWVSLRGSSLSFSLVLRPSAREAASPTLLTGLAAVAVLDALKKLGLPAQIKWPNDVLIRGRKVAGILVESVWTGNALDAAVIGVGVNVLAGSVPPAEELLFPATCVEAELGRPLGRVDLLGSILAALVEWRPRLADGELVNAWEADLAYKQEQVEVWQDRESPLPGVILGLEADGSLRLMRNNKVITVQFGEIHLRPSV